MRLSVRNDLESRRPARFSSSRSAALATAEDSLQSAQTCQQHTRAHEAAQRDDREVAMVWPVRPEQTEGTRQRITDGDRCQPQSDQARGKSRRRKLRHQRHPHRRQPDFAGCDQDVAADYCATILPLPMTSYRLRNT